ncbi:MAG: hypothetical protein LUD00_02195, partial [Prevotellaceae bacterium]|nr:hypothetical protein [Prevotellaceae bacterium]
MYIFSRVFSTDSSCIFSRCVLDRLLMRDFHVLAYVFDRLLRRYRATSPNLGEELSYRIGCYRQWDFHSLFKLWY